MEYMYIESVVSTRVINIFYFSVSYLRYCLLREIVQMCVKQQRSVFIKVLESRLEEVAPCVDNIDAVGT